MIKEINRYFELELKENRDYHPNDLKLNGSFSFLA